MERLDKYLCDSLDFTRSEIKKEIAKGNVTVNDKTVTKPDFKINPEGDKVYYKNTIVEPFSFSYYMMNKPKGVVSATEDRNDKTVLDLIKEKNRNLSMVGRLDKDTTGLLLLTDDGELLHKLISPRHRIFKKYFVTVSSPLDDNSLKIFETGVDIGDEKPTLPASYEIVDDYHLYLSICEGRFHQVKRMLSAIGNNVTELKRVSEGNLSLDESLLPGDYRKLTEEEIKELREC